jgi:DNA-binding transcriptional regulator PaaX
MIRRRQFLLGTLAVVAVAGIAVVGFGRMAGEAEIVSLVRRRLGFLRLDDAGLHAFARDQAAALLAKRPTWNRMKYHFLSVFSKSFTRWNRSSDRRSRKERLADNLASTYLLSSDFFLNHADETRVVQYVSLYDPMRACGNPFARPPVDAQTPG